MKILTNRRKVLKGAAVMGAGLLASPSYSFNILKNRKSDSKILGHGNMQYKIDKEWGTQDPSKIPVKDCHEMVQDAKGRLILLTNETKNNVLIYDKSGKVLSTWGDAFPGAHGLTLANENDEEFLFITDTDRHQIFKTTMDGKVLMKLDYPRETGVYDYPGQYKPTEIAVAPNGDFYVADGYGLDYVIQYNAKGEYIKHFAGKGDGEDQVKNAHGVCVDSRSGEPCLLVTSRQMQEFKRYTLDGKYIETIKTPGAWICRPVIAGDYLYFAVIVNKSWDYYDGFVLIMDKDYKVVSAPGGISPSYSGSTLNELKTEGTWFMNPHDVCVDDEGNLYIPQWNSGKTYPVKLEKV
ncbi:MAG: 6-bladed beta-propeller [Thalassobius sp.]|nr:6-bladed beta-propeller [Thalassovita sp.]